MNLCDPMLLCPLRPPIGTNLSFRVLQWSSEVKARPHFAAPQSSLNSCRGLLFTAVVFVILIFGNVDPLSVQCLVARECPFGLRAAAARGGVAVHLGLTMFDGPFGPPVRVSLPLSLPLSVCASLVASLSLKLQHRQLMPLLAQLTSLC